MNRGRLKENFVKKGKIDDKSENPAYKLLYTKKPKILLQPIIIFPGMVAAGKPEPPLTIALRKK